MSVEDTDGESETENRLEKGDRVRLEEGGGTETAKVKALTSGSWVHLTGGRMMRISDLDVVGDGEKTDGEKLVDALSQLSDSQPRTWKRGARIASNTLISRFCKRLNAPNSALKTTCLRARIARTPQSTKPNGENLVRATRE
jgi:hypothetical protein